MSHERRAQPSRPKPYELFGFNEQEALNGWVSQARFQEILNDDQTAIHSAGESFNNYGEFLFLTFSRLTPQRRIYVTFFGLGFHEYRERWLIDTWFWYQTSPSCVDIEHTIPKEEVKDRIQQRSENICRCARSDTQTTRGKLFEMLADLTDEDGAYAELQDLDDLANELGNELDTAGLP